MMVLLIITALAVSGFGLYAIQQGKASALRLQLPRSEAARWRLRLWVLLLINCLVCLVMTLHGDSVFNTTVGYVFRLLKFNPGADSWEPMSLAIEHMRQHPDIPVYSQIFFKDHIKFQYPLSSLVFLDVFQRFSHAPWATVYRVFDYVSLMCVPAIGLVSYFLLRGNEEK